MLSDVRPALMAMAGFVKSCDDTVFGGYLLLSARVLFSRRVVGGLGDSVALV